jgi:hypothetical protein
MIENMTDIVPQSDEECFNIVCGDSRTFELRSTVSKQDAAAWVDALNKQRHVYDTHQRLAQYQAQQAVLEAEQAKEAAAQRAASKETAAANAHHSATSYFTRLAATKPATPVGSMTASMTSPSPSWSQLSPTASVVSRLSFSSPTLPPRHGSFSHAQPPPPPPPRVNAPAVVDAACVSDHSDDEAVPAPPPPPSAPPPSAPHDGQFDDEKHSHDSDDDDLPPPPPSPPRSESPGQNASHSMPPMSLNSGSCAV